MKKTTTLYNISTAFSNLKTIVKVIFSLKYLSEIFYRTRKKTTTVH